METGESNEGMQCCPEACFQMMSKAMPDCCTPQVPEKVLRGLPENCRTKMGEMMSQFFVATQATESKPKEAV
jgi:hypothetical protein